MFNYNVLFANDDVLTQWIMSDVLAESGFNVTSACRAQQVIDLLLDDPDYDLLIVDLALSDTAGTTDIGQCWNKMRAGRPVIYTGSDRSVLRRPLRSGESFLQTPFSAGVLLRTIDRALEDACFRPFSPAFSQARHQTH